MSAADVEIVRAVYGHWERGDYAGANVHMADDLVYIRIGAELPGFDGEFRGLAEAGRAVADYLSAFSDVRDRADRIVDLGDRVFVVDHQTAIGRHSGAVVERDFGQFLTVRDGEVVHIEHYWHLGEALRRAGLEA